MSSGLTKKQFDLDHIGWDLTRAARAWKALFVASMVQRGHLWFAEARGNLIQFIGPHGIKQQELVTKIALSKQAVQQLLDELEADGIVKREVDRKDARGRLIVFTAKGLLALQDAQDIKLEIEHQYKKQIGKDGLRHLKSALDKIAAISEEKR